MTTQQLLEVKNKLGDKMFKSSQALTDYCKPFRGAMGLTSDECRQSSEYKTLRQQFELDKHNLRAFNQATNKNKELQQAVKDQILERRLAKLNA